jgi:hypothetical protein
MCPASKPDVDNLAKSALDGMSGVVYIDDGQVVYLTISKYYSDTPMMMIDVFPITENMTNFQIIKPLIIDHYPDATDSKTID